MIRNFNINFTEKEISSIYQKIKGYPWNSITDLEGWEHGTNKTYLKEINNEKIYLSKVYAKDVFSCANKVLQHDPSFFLEKKTIVKTNY